MIRKPRTEKKFAAGNETAQTVVASLNRIFKKVEIEGLSADAANELSEDIRSVCERFDVCPKAAVLLAAIMEKTNSSNSCDEEDLANYIGCTNLEFFDFLEALRELEDKGVVSKYCGHRPNYKATLEALRAVEKNSEFAPRKMTGLGPDEFFSRLRRLMSEYRNDHIDDDRLHDELIRITEKNDQLLFCRKVMESPLWSDECNNTERRQFFYLCHRYVTNGNQSVPIDILMNFIEFMDDDQRIRRHIANGNTGLQKTGLVTFGIVDGFTDVKTLSLSDEVKRSFFDEVELAPEEIVNSKDIISCDSIKDQELFYNSAEEEQVERLASLLEDENFRNVQARLEEQGMPKGFSCLFCGAPGTGKTASLKALAKRTGRDIFWVDLASIKSKWVGESEQNMKALFDNYRKLVKTSEKAPILAVNEADAIFTKRITNVEQSVDNMYNAMTDIVLNELENLDGILIATTNLAGNMMDSKDNAMERRFLFKVEFGAPEEDVSTKIWKSKIKELSDCDARTLAHKYSFAGGNIENIARKSTIEYILSGKRPDVETLSKYCDEEVLSKKKKTREKIGFTA